MSVRPVPVGLCLALIHRFEGYRGLPELRRVQDPVGNWEIGWSHKLTGPDDPLWFSVITLDEADALAIEDLNKAAAGVCDALAAGRMTPAVDFLTDHQYAACIDFAYNEGIGRFAGSTFCYLIRHGDLSGAALELPKWVYGRVDGVEQKLDGLVTRRDAEAAYWATAEPVAA